MFTWILTSVLLMLNLCLWIGNICNGPLLGNASIARGLTCCKKLARHEASRKSWSTKFPLGGGGKPYLASGLWLLRLTTKPYFINCYNNYITFTPVSQELIQVPSTKETVVTISTYIWAASSEFVSSNIPPSQILTAHAQPFRGARDLAFCLTVPLDSLLWASSGGSGETARMRRLAWTFAARIGDKYQIRLTRPIFRPIFPLLFDRSLRMERLGAYQ